MDDRVLNRIDRAAGVDDLAGVLTQLAPTDLQSLLLEVYSRRIRRMSAKAVLQQYERNRFVSPASSDPRTLIAFDLEAFSRLPPGYEPIELSPVAPLGTSAVLAGLSQDWAVTTARNTEVVSDSTNVLALECASRRRRDRTRSVKLASSHRLLRGQDYRGRGQSHFRVLGLAAAGRARDFELNALVEQIEFYRAHLGDIRIALTPLDDGTLANAVNERMGHPLEIDSSRSSGREYYVQLCFKIYRGSAEIGDGGFVGWTQRLLGDKKESLLISGIGTERAVTGGSITCGPVRLDATRVQA